MAAPIMIAASPATAVAPVTPETSAVDADKPATSPGATDMRSTEAASTSPETAPSSQAKELVESEEQPKQQMLTIPLDAPQWVKDLWPVVYNDELGAEFDAVVGSWLVFEWKCGWVTGKNLSLKKHPQRVSSWIMGGCQKVIDVSGTYMGFAQEF